MTKDEYIKNDPFRHLVDPDTHEREKARIKEDIKNSKKLNIWTHALAAVAGGAVSMFLNNYVSERKKIGNGATVMGKPI